MPTEELKKLLEEEEKKRIQEFPYNMIYLWDLLRQTEEK